ncbi:hypothetical protein DFH11DRAFT_1733190 [Phellopilus nigrolimitatus]|nr:hypothetical protein DFH11DRAFT_1733190 [Phellopilus nigrolimitatus]
MRVVLIMSIFVLLRLRLDYALRVTVYSCEISLGNSSSNSSNFAPTYADEWRRFRRNQTTSWAIGPPIAHGSNSNNVDYIAQ